MNIRLATQSDLEALTELYNQAIRAKEITADTIEYSVAQRQRWFDAHNEEKYPIYVAEIDGKVVGYASFSHYRPRHAVRFTAEISYYVDFEYHGQGVGSALMSFLLELAPSLEIKTVIAILMETNVHSVSLLKKFGFGQWGYLPNVSDFDGKEISHLYYGKRI